MDIKTEQLFSKNNNIAQINRGQKRCLGCMEIISAENEVCPLCGYCESVIEPNGLYLYHGTVLKDKYIIGRILGYGGFGVTYLAWDTVLQMKVAIKEYLPSQFATRSTGRTQVDIFSGEKSVQFHKGLEKFVDEAKRLALFRSEPGIVNVFDSFKENSTAYLVMEYLEGETLASRLERDGVIGADEAVQMLLPLMESLSKVHESGIIHRDIAPDNIFLTAKGEVKLIDFGAARYSVSPEFKETIVFKTGYSPEEQYSNEGEQGTYTDVYSLGAVLYRMVTGHIPCDALERRAYYELHKKDALAPIKKFTKKISKNHEKAIYNALNVLAEERTPDIQSFVQELASADSVKRRKSLFDKRFTVKAKLGIALASLLLVVCIAFGVVSLLSHKPELETSFTVPDGYALVPDVVSVELDQAQATIKETNLQWRISDRLETNEIKKNYVLSQSPEAFKMVELGTFIDVVISDGLGKQVVADVIGYSSAMATELLEKLGFVVTVEEQESSDYPEGFVISQSERSNSVLEKGSQITLEVSKGNGNADTSETVTIPDIVGKDFIETVKYYNKMNISIYRSKNAYDETRPVGEIIAQSPEGDSTGYQGDKVYVTVNQGEEKAVVRSVVDKKEASAIEYIEKLGLNTKVVYGESNTHAKGSVYKQDLLEGTVVPLGTTVTIFVSTGSTVTVPDISGMSLQEARKALVSVGLVCGEITYEKNDMVEKDFVISQSKAADSKVEQGTMVNMVVSSGNATKAKDIVLQGSCGDRLRFVLYKNGTLVISGSGKIADYSLSFTAPWYEKRDLIKSIKIESGITGIGNYTFAFCENIVSVLIPDTVTVIGNGAFKECINLENVSIPDSVVQMGSESFAYCTKLTEVVISNGVKIIGDSAFKGCKQLKTVKIPDGVSSIGASAFAECSSLKTIEIPDSVIKIGAKAFDSCDSLTTAKMPEDLINTAGKVFTSCNNLDEIYNNNGKKAEVEKLLDKAVQNAVEQIPEEAVSQIVAGIVENISEDDIADISKQVIEQLPAVVADNLSEEDIKDITNYVIDNLPEDVLKNISTEDVVNLVTQVIENIPEDALSDLSGEEITKLVIQVIENVPQETLIKVAKGVLENIPADVIANISESILSNISQEDISAITNQVLASLPADTSDKLTKDFVTDIVKQVIANLPEDVLDNISIEAIADIVKQIISNMPEEAFGNVSSTDLSALVKQFIGKIPKDTLEKLAKGVIDNIPKDLLSDIAQNVLGNFSWDFLKEIPLDTVGDIAKDVVSGVIKSYN